MTRIPLPIAADHPAFAGHFPSQPIVPGVVLLDECLRALGDRANACRIASAKFVSMVRPGEAVCVDVEAGATADTVRLRVMAGTGPDERLAMSGTVVYASVGAR